MIHLFLMQNVDHCFEGVELLLEQEERVWPGRESGAPHSWEALDPVRATYTPDITPLILAAHKNNYEILKILLDRGAQLPRPHEEREKILLKMWKNRDGRTHNYVH